MSMASSIKKAGPVLALLLAALALPARSDEKAQQPTPATADSAQTEAQPGTTPAGEEAPKPATAPAPAVAATPAAIQVKAAPPIQTPPESSTPPKNLRKVGDHWTPYEPPDPESFPEGAQVHKIVNGDTLWDLANTQFQNPYLWPQIWNENRYILDSHWIYPGDPLLLPPRPTVVSEIVPAGTQTAPPLPPAPEAGAQEPAPVPPSLAAPTESAAQTEPPESGAAGLGSGESAPFAAADASDLYCTGEIRPDYRKAKVYISNEEQERKVGLTEGDLIYLNGGRQGNRVQPGEVLQVIAKEEEVFHPVTDRWLGTYVRHAGLVKVLAVQENTAIAEIIQSCGDRIEVGFEVEPFQERQVPELRDVPFSRLDVEPSGKANGYVVRVQDNRNQAFTGNVVDVDLGSKDGLKPGDVMQIYLNNEPPVERQVTFSYKWGNRRYESLDLRNEDRNLLYPRKPIGQLLVLTTGEKTATAKIVYAVREVEVGSLVEVR